MGILQWSAENRTSGLANRTKICPVIEYLDFERPKSILYVRFSNVSEIRTFMSGFQTFEIETGSKPVWNRFCMFWTFWFDDKNRQTEQTTVTRRKPDVRFGKPDINLSGFRTSGYRTSGPFQFHRPVIERSVPIGSNRTTSSKPVPNRFQTSFWFRTLIDQTFEIRT